MGGNVALLKSWIALLSGKVNENQLHYPVDKDLSSG